MHLSRIETYMRPCRMPGIEGDLQCKRTQISRDERVSGRVVRKEVSNGRDFGSDERLRERIPVLVRRSHAHVTVHIPFGAVFKI